MISDAGISHALLLDDDEIAELQSGEIAIVRRRARTKLQMRVAILRKTTDKVVGTAYLTGSIPDGDEDNPPSGYRWLLNDASWLDAAHPISVSRSGPLWIRLPQS